MPPHNINLMHQERNVAESIVSMCFDVTEKSKDNIKARKDLALLCDGPNLKVRLNGKGKECRPRAEYCPKPKERKHNFEWLKTLKFPDRYAPNLKLAVNVKTEKLTGLKSHDYHIIIERLLLVMFRGYFKDDHLEEFDGEVCEGNSGACMQIEKSDSSWFDEYDAASVDSLALGSIGWWTRSMQKLKKLRATLRNKARVEGCIAEAFALKEMSHFTKKYFNKVDAEKHSNR
ncbi:hypothetical protein U9M48_008309, partial [Paspalum notatum var. saurae]